MKAMKFGIENGKLNGEKREKQIFGPMFGVIELVKNSKFMIVMDSNARCVYFGTRSSRTRRPPFDFIDPFCLRAKFIIKILLSFLESIQLINEVLLLMVQLNKLPTKQLPTD